MCKKLNFNYIKQSFEKERYILLTKTYINSKQKLDYICPNGHKYAISWSNWQRGRRCPCFANRSLMTIEFVESSFKEAGYTLLTKNYINAKQKFDYICPNGHRHHITWGHWQSGKRCPYCVGNVKHTIELIRSGFEKEGYILLTEIYKNASQKLDYVCPNGHKHAISWVNWRAGCRCPYCSNYIKKSFEYVESSFTDHDYTLLTREYISSNQMLDYICPNGHKHSITWSSWNAGHRCSYCYGNVKKTIEEVNESFEAEDYILITDNYKNCNQKLHLICPKGHEYFTTWGNWNHNGSRCPKCNLKGISKEEMTLLDYLKNSYSNEIISNSYNLITPKELDIVIPDKKLAIEYCGLYWHSELAGKDKNYHLHKLNLCNDAGYKLITIFSDEWLNKREIVESRLLTILNCSEKLKTIHGRKCQIKEISTSEARNFCEQNHLQGYTGSKVKLGAFHNGELVSVMTFAKPSISKGSNPKEPGVWELSRFCSKINHRIPGIASKLLKFFEKNYEWIKIFSYADRRWSSGGLYEKLGFTFVKETKPNYWYIREQYRERTHRFNLRKQPDEPKNITEWELRKADGWNRIWDCGNLKYVKIY